MALTDLAVKKKPAGSLTRLPTGVTMENASRKESVWSAPVASKFLAWDNQKPWAWLARLPFGANRCTISHQVRLSR